MRLRRNRGAVAFRRSSDEAATTLIWLALRHITAEWVRPATHDVDGCGSSGRHRSAGHQTREAQNRLTHKVSDRP